MSDIHLCQRDLLDENSPPLLGEGEFYVLRLLLPQWHDASARAEWCMQNLPLTGDLLLEVEDSHLLREALDSYVIGNFLAATLCSDALCERLLTDLAEALELIKPAKRGLAAILANIGDVIDIPTHVIDRLGRLHKIRNNYVHEKGPDHEFRLFRRALSTRASPEEVMHEDAREAICLAYGLAARIKRSFPRLGLSAPE